MGLAVTRYFKGKDGEKKDDTTFVDVTVWEKTAEYCSQRLRQGRPILVEGRLKSDSWEDKTTGQKRTKIEVQAQRVQELDWSEDRPAAAPKPEPEPRPAEEPIPEDDIPF
jgi:single-strand DNA-binding protein